MTNDKRRLQLVQDVINQFKTVYEIYGIKKIADQMEIEQQKVCDVLEGNLPTEKSFLIKILKLSQYKKARELVNITNDLIYEIMPDALKKLSHELTRLKKNKGCEYVQNETGVTRQQIDNYIKGKYYPTAETLDRLSNVIDSSIINPVYSELFGKMSIKVATPERMTEIVKTFSSEDKINAILLLAEDLSQFLPKDAMRASKKWSDQDKEKVIFDLLEDLPSTNLLQISQKVAEELLNSSDR